MEEEVKTKVAQHVPRIIFNVFKFSSFWRKRRPYLCSVFFFKKGSKTDQSPLKRTQLVSLGRDIFAPFGCRGGFWPEYRYIKSPEIF